MRYIITDFDNDELNKFIDATNKLEKDEPLDIYIDSNGGQTLVQQIFTTILEQESKKREVTMYGVVLMSSAFNLFLFTNVNKVVLNDCYGGIHFAGWDVNLGDNAIPRGAYEKFKQNIQLKSKNPYNFLTEDELKIYNEGEIVYIDSDRIKEIILNSKD